MKRFIITFLFSFILLTQLQAQNIQHFPPPAFELNQQQRLEFNVPGLASSSVLEASLFYRYSDDLSFRQTPAFAGDGRVNVTITPNNSSASAFEYYLLIELDNGTILSYPQDDPTEDPVQVPLVDQAQHSEVKNVNYSILTPEPGSRINPADFMLAVTFYYEDDAAAENITFRLLIDGMDVSEMADISPYLITFVPETELASGDTSIEILMEQDGVEQSLVSWDVKLSERRRRAEVFADIGGPPVVPRSGLIPRGQIEVAARSQSLGGRETESARTSFRASGTEGNFRYSVNGLFTTEENARLQPQNRFGAELYYGNWFELQAGHIYPSMNPFLISSNRIYGVNAGVNLLRENVQFQFMHGRLSRPVTPLYGELDRSVNTITDSSGNPLLDSQGNTINDTTYTLGLQDRGFGTYKRNITGFRFGLGSGRTFGWNINALRIEDDINSINVISEFDDLSTEQLNNLSTQDRQRLANNPDLLQVNQGAPNPQGNFALATDFTFRFDQGRVLWRTDLAGSLLNNDITGGILTTERADDLGWDIDNDVVDVFDRLSWLIIINENMSSLPLRIEDGNASAFVPGGIFAGKSQLNLNYFGHNLTVQYRWIGPDYVSLANTSQRRDISGYTITDRFRMFSNSIFMTLSHEILQDNVINNRDATTTSMTNRANISWFPQDRFMPKISVGVRHRIRDNNVERQNPLLPENLRNRAVRNARQNDAGEFVTMANPRDNTTLQFNGSVSQLFALFNQDHDLNLNFTIVNTNDNVFDYGDFSSASVGAQIITRYSTLPLRTRIGFDYLTTEAVSGLNTVDVTGFNAGLDYFLLQNRLSVNLDFAFTNNKSTAVPLQAVRFEPSGGLPSSAEEQALLLYYKPDEDPANTVTTENTAFVISGGARYDFARNHSVFLLFNYTSLSDQLTNLNLPNDHLVQLRYVTRF